MKSGLAFLLTVVLFFSHFSIKVLATRPDNSRRFWTTSHAIDGTHRRIALSSRADPDIALISERRISGIIGKLSGNGGGISSWLSSLQGNGKWPDSEVDYTTGCNAQRANWPAQTHWSRIVVMSAAWHGGLNSASASYVKSNALRQSISSAMSYWFSRDFVGEACMDQGGTDKCPCSNPDNALWNPNWFSNIILIPKLVSETCLILGNTLTSQELAKCSQISSRSYKTLARGVVGISAGLTGANALDVARIGINNALLKGDVTTLSETIKRVQSELIVQDAVRADGVRADGSFGQHKGLIYTGNYGRDFGNGAVELELEVKGTKYASAAPQRSALETFYDGSKWMVVRNAVNGVLHWDVSVIGRFLVFPVSDYQPTRDLGVNLTKIGELGSTWNSQPLNVFANLAASTTNANAGKLVGNKMFLTNDYMVHRGDNYVSTLRIWSKRTKNTECINAANPFGFHLASGATFHYIQGDEYEDIAAPWNWNLIPGITTNYKNTPLNCEQAEKLGVEAFVGGTSTGKYGVAAMRYTNPLTKTLKWQKAWFYLPGDVQHVMISGVTSSSAASVVSVLDQRRHRGTIYVNDVAVTTSNTTSPRTLWHGDVGYLFPTSNAGASLSVQVGVKSGNWQAISTSSAPTSSLDIFAAFLNHKAPLGSSIAYSVFPGTSRTVFKQKSDALRLTTIKNDAQISAVYDQTNNFAMFVFWNAAGGSVTFTPAAAGSAPITFKIDVASTVTYNVQTGQIHVADPSQSLTIAKVAVSIGSGKPPPVWTASGTTKTLTWTLPQGGLAGQSTSKTIK